MAEVEEDAPSKGGLIKIILIILIVLLVAVGSALARCFLQVFSMIKRPMRQRRQLPNLKQRLKALMRCKCLRQCRRTWLRKKNSSLLTKTSRSPLLRISSARKVMQVTLAVMTYYGEKVTEKVDEHEFAIRSAVLDRLRLVSEAGSCEKRISAVTCRRS